MDKVARQLWILCFFIFTILTNTKSYAQFVNYSTKDGMSIHSIDNISEDDEGLIYFASAKGMDVFNGNTFKNYNQTNTPGFSNNIKTILTLKKGFILIGSADKGLFLLNKYKQTMVSISLDNGDQKQVDNIVSLYLDQENTVWIGCDDGKLLAFSASIINEEITQNIVIKTSMVMQYAGAIECILTVGDYLLIGGKSNYLSRVRKVNDNYVVDSPFKIAASTIYSLLLNKNNLWIGTDTGIFKTEITDNVSFSAINILSKPWKLEDHIIRDLTFHNDHIWVGTEGKGLYTIAVDGSFLNHYSYSEQKRNSLHSNYVLCTYMDSNDNLWLGTWFGGVDVLNLNKSAFSFVYDKEKEKDLFSNIIWDILEIPDGRVFLGTHGNGLCLYYPESNYFASVASNTEIKSISSLYYDLKTKLIYIGTWGHGMRLYDTKNNVLIPIRSEFTPLLGHRIYSMFKDPYGQLWIGTFNDGLYRYSFDKDSLEKITLSKRTPLNGIDIRSIQFDEKHGEILVSSITNGLFKIKLDDSGRIKGLEQHLEFKDGVRNIFKDKEGAFWLLLNNEKGVVKLNSSSQMKPLFKNTINNAMIKTDDNHLLVGSYSGILNMNLDTNETTSMLTYLTIYDLHYDLKSNTVLAASNNGLIKLSLDYHRDNKHFSKVELSNLKILDKQVLPDEKLRGKTVLKRKLDYSDTIVLPYFSQTFSLDITALSFDKDKKEKLRYRLQGFEKLWNEVTASTTVSYTNVPSGSYQLQVQVAGDENTWSSNVRQLTIIKQKPWWFSIWAYLAYLLLITGITLVIVKELNARFKLNQELKLQKLTHKREQELYQEKISFFTNISHDIRTPLTLIVSPLEEIITSENLSETVQLKLHRMLKNSKMLMSLVNQILDFRKAETGNINLHLKRIDLNVFVQRVYYQFHELAQNKTIDFEISLPEEQIILVADPNKLESILFNLISNAIKFTPKYGHIIIQVSEENGYVNISVKDTGLGILESEFENIFKRFYQSKASNLLQQGTGIGMALVKKYIEAHKGKININSKINEGTEFIVRFPILSSIDGFDEHISLSEIDLDISKENALDEATHKSSKKIILVVDDSKDIRDYLKEILEVKYSVYLAESAEVGLEIAKKRSPHLVVSDLMMDGMDGIELCSILKSDINTSHIPVILLTAKNSMESKLEGFEKGADAYIEKPFNSKLLLTRIKKIIEDRDLLRKKFLLSNSSSQELDGTSVDEGFMKMIVENIEKNISNPNFFIKNLVDCTYLSQDQLYRKIKALTGLSINHFIRLVRLKKAANLLLGGKYTVSEVLYMVGFNNPSYFTKCFKAEYGVLPSEYISKKKSKDES